MIKFKSPALTAAAGFALFAFPLPVFAQSDNFDDGDDAGWLRYDPLGLPGNGWEFSDGAYQITAAANPLQAISGGGRAGAFRTDTTLSNFRIEVDVLPGWNPAKNAGFGIVARIQPGSIGLGNTDGYSFNYVQSGSNVRISRFTNESPVNLTVPRSLPLDPAVTHRMIFTGDGSCLEGRIYALPDVIHPLVVVAATDSTWAAGHGGLLVFDNNGGQGAGATFDNYRSGPLDPPALSISHDGNDVLLTWPAFPLCFKLQSSPSLDTDSWVDSAAAGISYSAASDTFSFREPVSPSKPSGFFRLVRNVP